MRENNLLRARIINIEQKTYGSSDFTMSKSEIEAEKSKFKQQQGQEDQDTINPEIEETKGGTFAHEPDPQDI